MDTPECDKMITVAPDSQKIGEFIDWLHERAIFLASYPDPRTNWEDRHGTQLLPISTPIDQLLADYFKIDLVKVETERRAMLEQLRSCR